MTTPALFPYTISFNYKRSNAPRLRKAQFGDGYLQTVPDGINYNPESWDWTCDDLLSNLDQVDAYLSGNGAVPFYWWTPRGYMIRVQCFTWQRTDATSGWGQISGTFTQIFDGDPLGLFALASAYSGASGLNAWMQAVEGAVNTNMASIGA